MCKQDGHSRRTDRTTSMPPPLDLHCACDDARLCGIAVLPYIQYLRQSAVARSKRRIRRKGGQRRKKNQGVVATMADRPTDRARVRACVRSSVIFVGLPLPAIVGPSVQAGPYILGLFHDRLRQGQRQR
ncbi:uncharacterized protein PFL1_03550 [Pseudozyma flocculosa PF-1]|uniref:Uncharacterized protein n=1 Tax=Pseudozyma flocculosa PF-1 TaxID=1277687 RepID=A0A061H766_9BASI|nr:uncharacterized protein PFL1_03550 [Pseudozyma flocculosa PF-1]EPQ28747.1 hypothetical protein PFL1_03550 [Pseudozyma flocculosa PF-1]